MRHGTCYLPNGQSFTVTPVFGGFNFKSNDLTLHHSVLPPGWTIVLYTRDDDESSEKDEKDRQRRFTDPTLRNDCLHIASTVDPSSEDFKPASSPTRQIALLLYITLWWYFHEQEPDLHLHSANSAKTPLLGKPKGDWRINIKREGIFKKRNLLQKLERMGLIATEDSSVGLEPNENQDSGAWDNMFVSRRSFWQLDPRLFLFTLAPAGIPASITRQQISSPTTDEQARLRKEGPFTSGSHLPTYFPPPPTQYTFTNGVRHPLRTRPPHQGEVVYIRYIPSVDQYLSFRVPYFSPSKQSQSVSPGTTPPSGSNHTHSLSSSSAIGMQQPQPKDGPTDLEILHKWMNDPRVNAAWGEAGPIEHQQEFLRHNLASHHSFPVFGCWDGKPFGYFEIYWAKEDRLGPLLGGLGNYDRGIHLLVGEQEYRGSHRVNIWLSSLVHYAWLADSRTETVLLEPRIDNEKVISYLQKSGFYKEGEVTFPHKQSAVMKIKRDSWEAPAI
ncbi:GNAT family N-acetyltransferase [Aspergillus glaucus CBS 516.65]|uniref:Acyltransferase MbtK/IucB-like conserved domain-containing protein n=1 Tax=Aspergillus glaucus CBS 516.65 TaxID=1160497 RepID=A0A1L9VRI5_ASPGL|nr:hypothetical protein ASPGLDRAFT_44325 [Aspergillus glaucus CBS 516.65]OJJ86519.1 hypothetical protein ASPGLDRAFT_44325 [Aspergillus glaucus CBS 516.65]